MKKKNSARTTEILAETMEDRIEVAKTYKLYIGGAFPRTESGRYYPLKLVNGEIVNVCLSSRKDFRNAVTAARSAFRSWSEKAAFNRGQILYRIAEMMEGRKDQFVQELKLQGATAAEAAKECSLAVDRAVYYAGWSDKYTQVFSSVNPVASSHFNFSLPEPTGVVAILAEESTSLIGLVSLILPVIAGGNTCVILASQSRPLCSVTFAEVLAVSDLPGGVVNILTGSAKELSGQFSSHMDVNAVVCCLTDAEEKKAIQDSAAANLKRVFFHTKDWMEAENENPYLILDTQEIKTTWHPVETGGAAGAAY